MLHSDNWGYGSPNIEFIFAIFAIILIPNIPGPLFALIFWEGATLLKLWLIIVPAYVIFMLSVQACFGFALRGIFVLMPIILLGMIITGVVISFMHPWSMFNITCLIYCFVYFIVILMYSIARDDNYYTGI